jgi:hypothetical protein
MLRIRLLRVNFHRHFEKEDPLAEELLRGNIKQGDTLDVHAADEQLVFIIALAATS